MHDILEDLIHNSRDEASENNTFVRLLPSEENEDIFDSCLNLHHSPNSEYKIRHEDFAHDIELYSNESINDIKCEESEIYKPNILLNTKVQDPDSSLSINTSNVNESHDTLIEVLKTVDETTVLKKSEKQTINKKISKSRRKKTTKCKQLRVLRLEIDITKQPRASRSWSAPYLNLRRFKRKDQTQSHPQDSITKKAPGKNSIKNVTESTKSLNNKKCEEKLGSVKKLEANNNGIVNISDKSVSDDSLKAHKLTKTHKNRKIRSPTTKNNPRKNYLVNQTMIQKTKELQQTLCNMSNSNKGFEVKKRNGNLSNPKESDSNKKDVTSKDHILENEGHLKKQNTPIDTKKQGVDKGDSAEGINLRSRISSTKSNILDDSEKLHSLHTYFKEKQLDVNKSNTLGNVPARNAQSGNHLNSLKQSSVNDNEPSNSSDILEYIQMINEELNINEKNDLDFKMNNNSNKISRELFDKHKTSDSILNKKNTVPNKSNEYTSNLSSTNSKTVELSEFLFPESSLFTRPTRNRSTGNDQHSSEMDDLNKINKELNDLFLHYDLTRSTKTATSKDKECDSINTNAFEVQKHLNTSTMNVSGMSDVEKKADNKKQKASSASNIKHKITKKNTRCFKKHRNRSINKKLSDKMLDQTTEQKIIDIVEDFNNVISGMQEKLSGIMEKHQINSKNHNALNDSKLNLIYPQINADSLHEMRINEHENETNLKLICTSENEKNITAVEQTKKDVTLNLENEYELLNKGTTKEINGNIMNSLNRKLRSYKSEKKVNKNDENSLLNKSGLGNQNMISQNQSENDNSVGKINKTLEDIKKINVISIEYLNNKADPIDINNLTLGSNNISLKNSAVNTNNNDVNARFSIDMITPSALIKSENETDNDTNRSDTNDETSTDQTISDYEQMYRDVMNEEDNNDKLGIIDTLYDKVIPLTSTKRKSKDYNLPTTVNIEPLRQKTEQSKQMLKNSLKVCENQVKILQNLSTSKRTTKPRNRKKKVEQVTKPTKDTRTACTKTRSKRLPSRSKPKEVTTINPVIYSQSNTNISLPIHSGNSSAVTSKIVPKYYVFDKHYGQYMGVIDSVSSTGPIQFSNHSNQEISPPIASPIIISNPTSTLSLAENNLLLVPSNINMANCMNVSQYPSHITPVVNLSQISFHDMGKYGMSNAERVQSQTTLDPNLLVNNAHFSQINAINVTNSTSMINYDINDQISVQNGTLLSLSNHSIPQNISVEQAHNYSHQQKVNLRMKPLLSKSAVSADNKTSKVTVHAAVGKKRKATATKKL